MADPQPVARPAFAAVRGLADCYVLSGRDCPGAPPVATPGALTLPAAGLDRASEATVTVADPGGEPVSFGPAAVGGGFPAGALAIEADSCSGAILEPATSCAVTVRFTPAAAGTIAGALTLPYDRGTVTVALSATSPSVSSLRASPPVPAPGQADGVDHAQRFSITVANPLGGPVRVATAGAGGPGFAVVADGCAGVSLWPGAACSVVVRWRPAAAGVGRGSLVLRGDGSPLQLALGPRAYPVPRITGLQVASTGRHPGGQPAAPRDGCLPPAGGTVWAVLDQPAAVSFSLRRLRRPADPRCVVAGRPRPRPRVTSGVDADPGRRVALHLRGHRAPGAYRLTARATNHHGQGPPSSLWLTVP